MACAVSTETTPHPAAAFSERGAAATFDSSLAWRVHPSVEVRPEPFGALLYHFGTRRLTFLKDRRLLAAIQELAAHPDARSACRAAGIDPSEQPRFDAALDRLTQIQMLVPVEASVQPPAETPVENQESR